MATMTTMVRARCRSAPPATTTMGSRPAAPQPRAAPRLSPRHGRALPPPQSSTLSSLLMLADVAGSETTAELGKFAGDRGSYWASLGLVILTAPGLWSLVKRAPKASVKSMTFEVPGPAQGGSLDKTASAIATYFTRYNYKIVETGEVITFQGTYEANRGQGIALTFYVFLGLASISLVLSIVNQEVGNWWYALLLLTPGAYFYYMSNGTRVEEAKVKMVTSDDEKFTDIILQCDKEELERFAMETGYVEKGKVKVKGLLEDTPLVQSSSSSAKGFGGDK